MLDKIKRILSCDKLSGNIIIVGSLSLRYFGLIDREPSDIDIYSPGNTQYVEGVHNLDYSALYPGWDVVCDIYEARGKRVSVVYPENVICAKICRGYEIDWQDIETCLQRQEHVFMLRGLIRKYILQQTVFDKEVVEKNWEHYKWLFQQYFSIW